MPQGKNRKNGVCKIEERRQRVAELYLKGKSQWDVAKEIGVTQALVSMDLKVLREQWLAEAKMDFAARQAQELAKIDHLEKLALAAWERSCADAETRVQKRELARLIQMRKELGRQRNNVKKNDDIAGDDHQNQEPLAELVPVKEVSEKTKKGQSGNPAFLEIVKGCIELRAKLFGLIKPPEVSMQQSFVNIDWNAPGSDGGAGAIEASIQRVLDHKPNGEENNGTAAALVPTAKTEEAPVA
jgi:predicted transcriptional regulator